MTFVSTAGNASTRPAPGSRWLARCQWNPIYWPSGLYKILQMADVPGPRLCYDRPGGMTARPALHAPVSAKQVRVLGRFTPEQGACSVSGRAGPIDR